MSLFGALTTGVSGLNAQSRAMGNISENLSNTQTTAFKRADTRFSHLVTSSSARNNTPGGVIATPAYQNNIQGTLLSTQSTTDLAITGGGFFAIADSATSATTNYSRRGDFALDKDGYLVNGAGQFLRGWTVTNPASTTGFSADTSVANPIRVDAAPVPPRQTQQLTYLANLPSNVTATNGDFVSSAQVYDQLGNLNTLSLRWQKTANPNQWNLSIGRTDQNGNRSNIVGQAFPGTGAPTAAAGSPYVATFGANGTLASIANGAPAPAATVATLPTTPAGTEDISLVDPFGGGSPLVISFGLTGSTAGLTQFADTNAQVSVRTLNQDGYTAGQFRELSISDDGYVTANYTNGTTRTLYQVPLASFASPNTLQRLDGGAYAPTLDSGQPILNAAGRGGTGSLTGNALEGSNVDVADEFSKMIVTQRIFSANARSITTSDQMLEEVVNLKR